MNILQIKRSEIQNRLEPKFYSQKYLSNEKSLYKSPYPVRKLSEVTMLISDGTHFTPKYQSSGKKFLSVKDVRASNIDYSNSMFISDAEFEILNKRCKPQRNDILLTKIGSIGFAAVVETDDDFQIFVSLALIRPKTWCVLPYYLELVLNSKLAYLQFDRYLKGAGVPDLHLEEIRNLKLPLPPISVQQTIVDLYTDAHNQRKRKLEEAQKLLESVDAYLLSELGIELPQEDNSLKNRIFMVSSSHLIGSRWDCSSNKNDFSLNSKKFENVKLVDVVRINPSVYFPLDIKEITFIPMEAIDEIYGEITDNYKKEVSESSGFTRFMQGDLIWAKITPCMQNGKSAVIRETINGYACGSTEFFVLRCNKNSIDVNYLFYIMHVKKLLEYATNFFGGNAGQQRVSKDFLLNLEIPLPPLDKQIDIASKLQEIQNNVKKLKNEADMILQEAKQKGERMILGDE